MEKETETTGTSHTGGEEERMGDECHELVQILPKEKTPEGVDLYLHEGFWYPSIIIHGIISFQRHFKALDTDMILVTLLKSGTTWLKALTFTIANRTKYPLNESPLLTTNPHSLIPSLENAVYRKNPIFNLEDIPCPRILATHAPYSALPDSLRDSSCRVVYLCRNPLDQFVSLSHFRANYMLRPYDPSLIDEGVDMFCRGVSSTGPFWDHVLGYWKASQERPDKFLFLKYEDMKEDTITNLKVLAEFMGFPFSVEEESQGMIEEILRLCSFDNLKDLEVNKTEKIYGGHPNSAFFRKAEVGDWANHLTPSMAERMKKLLEEKLEGSGLSFKFS